MEIEVKFAVPNTETCQRLQAVDHLADFALSAGQVKHVHDTYLDTAERTILAAGYACRWREQREREGILFTLKRLKGAEGAIHRREELEVWLPAGQPPGEWPASPVRDRVLQLIGETPLTPLFDLQQTRIVRLVSQGERPVAELSLDEVHLTVDDREQAYYELEVELTSQGTEDDLAPIVTCLQDEWGLEPEPRSKFERALAFLEEPPLETILLTPQEQAIFRQIATREDQYSRRAWALLALDEGGTQVEAGERAGLSARRVRHWLAEFQKRRLDIFPEHVLDEAQAALTAVPPEPPPEQALQPEPVELPQSLPLEVLFERYRVDQTHARTVTDHALALFDHLRPFHGLPPERRSLLEMAALVHNVGLETDPGRHHIAGRDILLVHPPAGLDDDERLIVALTTLLHRKRISPKKLDKLAQTSFADLPELAQTEALAMAALVRLADGLDYSQTSSSQLGQVQQQQGVVKIEVVGPYADIDAERAQTKSDLWRLLFETDLQFKPAPTGEIEDSLHRPEVLDQPAEQQVKTLRKPPKEPGLEADDSMAEAARKTCNLHFQRMLYHEPGTRLGEDIEELHDMRVATRRMRAAFQVFGDYLDMAQLAPIVKGLRRTGRALGAVRDLDVFWEKTQRYVDTLPPDQSDDLGPLRAVWEAERERARERMLAYLDSKRYARFKEEFGDFLQTPGAGALPVISRQGEPLPHRVRHVVPVAVYQRLGTVRAYDEWVTGPDVPLERLHQLRIAAKGLRYTLEYFREVLGPETQTLIDEVKALQDHLGDLQDAVVASNLLRDFLTWGTWGHAHTKGKKASWPAEPVVAPGVATYLAARQVELQHLVDTFPKVWTRFQKPEFGQLVASSIAPLLTTTNSFKEIGLMTTEPKNIVLLGPPASGKGTQAVQLRETLKLPHVASGDLFRENLTNETELGQKAKAYIDRGELVPDDVTIAMVMDRLSQPDCANGALLDGFPRTIAQAKALDEALDAQGHKVSVVPYITVPDEVLVERVSGRRLCRVCGESYHVRFNPPQQPGVCDNDGGELYQRDDDQPETVRKRLEVYWEQTSPLIDFYRNQGVLVEVNGDQPIEAVQADLRAATAHV